MALTLEQFAKQKGVRLPSERLGVELPSKPVGLDVFLKQRIGLKELPKERKIARLQAEAEQAMKRAEYLSSPMGLAKQTIKEIPSAVRKIVSRKGLLSPKGIQAAVEGAFRTAVISPVSAVTRFATKGKLDIEKGWAELTEPWRKTLTPAQKEIERGFAMGGLVVPYGAAEAAALKGISRLGKVEKVKPIAAFLLARPKLLKAGKIGVNMASFVGAGQILHKPEDGSRAKQAMVDAALAVAFPVIGYAVRKPLKAGLKLAMKRVEKVFEPIIEKIKLKKPVPLEEIERAVDQSKKVIKRTTGKSPEQVLKKEVLPKAIADSAKQGEIPKGKAVAGIERVIAKGKRPTDKQLDAAIKELERKIKIRVKEEAPELPTEAISKARGIKPLPKAKKPAEAKIEGIPKEAKPTLKATWQKLSTYPKKGDYVRVNWKGKTYEGTITGEKPVRFRTGYVAREITTKEGVKKWMPWTSSAKYEVKVEKPAKTKPVIKVEKPTPEIKPKRIKVPSEQLPVGEGKELASRLEKRIVERLSKVPERYKTVTYKQMNKAEQIKKAVDYVVKNESEAMEVLMGKKEPPKGLLYNSIFLAMEEKAKQNTALAVRLASLRATRSGQEISILTEADKNNPVRFLSEIQRDRVKIIGGREKVVKYTKSLVKQGKKILSKNYLKVDEWENFIKSIQC